MSEIEVRRAEPEDRPGIIALCRETLGWTVDDPDEAFFAWKHDDNAFGRSPAWVALSGDQIVGVRVFMRWGFIDGDGRHLRAVRAVDTATSPAFQGRGIFNRLTLGALPELREDGVDFVFNTPNDKSRPGYLKMGWGAVGRLPVSMRLSSVLSTLRVLSARTAAERWSVGVDVGVDPLDAFADDEQVASLLRSLRQERRVRTDRTPAFLRWRYSFPDLRYRVVPLGDSIRDGAVVLRFRRRGSALEGVVCERLIPSGSLREVPWREIAASSACDYFLAVDRGPLSERFIPVPRNGPILTWKPLCRPGMPAIGGLRLTLGDVELF